MNLLNLGFLSPHTPYDRRSFSGTAFFAFQALSRRPDVRLRVLGHTPRGMITRFFKGPVTLSDIDAIDMRGLDAVVGLVATPLLLQLARRHPGLPFVHVTDATPAFLRDCYGWSVPAAADEAEAEVAAAAASVAYSSHAIAARAPADLGLDSLTVDVVPFGVNAEGLPSQRPEKPSLNKVNLLFVGLDWVRKGGDIAVAALEQLRASGCDAHLSLVGKCPESLRDRKGISVHGFLDKNNARERALLKRLYEDAHLLLVPSRGDCAPMVVAEAMAYGTPVLAADTGGIRTLIGSTGTGHVLPQFAEPADWAREILDMTQDAEAYELMSDACFDRANTVLCWSGWARGIEGIIRRSDTIGTVEIAA